MPLWDDLTSRINSTAEVKRCRFGKIIDSLTVQEREVLDTAIKMATDEAHLPLRERVFTTTWFTTTFNNNGYSIGKTAVGDHLRGSCSCDFGK